MRGKAHRAAWLLVTMGGILASGPGWSQATIDDILKVEQRRIEVAQESQKKIDDVVDTTRDDFEAYQQVLKEIESIEVYNIQEQRVVDDQVAQLTEMRNEIANVQVIERQMLPLMVRMIDTLDKLIDLDVPFRVAERKQEVTFLTNLLDESDVTIAEKFRLVMEAWKTEIDYGTFNDTFTGSRDIDGSNREVDYVQIGRIALMYLTPDRMIGGMWDAKTKRWIDNVDEETRNSIASALDLIRSGNSANAELLMIPVAPPEE